MAGRKGPGTISTTKKRRSCRPTLPMRLGHWVVVAQVSGALEQVAALEGEYWEWLHAIVTPTEPDTETWGALGPWLDQVTDAQQMLARALRLLARLE